MGKRKRKTLYLPTDYLPPGLEFCASTYGISVVDERGVVNAYETERFAKITRYYRHIQFTDRNPNDE